MDNATTHKQPRLVGNWDYWTSELVDKFDELEGELLCSNWAGIGIYSDDGYTSHLSTYHNDRIEKSIEPENSLILESGMDLRYRIYQHWLKARMDAPEHYPYPEWLTEMVNSKFGDGVSSRIDRLLGEALDYMRKHNLGLSQDEFDMVKYRMSQCQMSEDDIEDKHKDEHYQAVKYIRDMWECQICGNQPADYHNVERETRCEKCLLIEARIGSGKCFTCYSEGDIYGEDSVCEFHFLEDSRTANYSICLQCAEVGILKLDGESHETHKQ